MMSMSSKELRYSVTQLSKIIPNVANYISPSLDVIYKLQNEVGDLNFKAIDEDNEDNTGIWQTLICVNAETTELHCENDCTFTLIVVPEQDNDKEQSAEYNFIFDLMKGFTVGIKMDPSVCILFSGKYLLHRQSCNTNTTLKDNMFINLASYGNERLYNHLKHTIKRMNT